MCINPTAGSPVLPPTTPPTPAPSPSTPPAGGPSFPSPVQTAPDKANGGPKSAVDGANGGPKGGGPTDGVAQLGGPNAAVVSQLKELVAKLTQLLESLRPSASGGGPGQVPGQLPVQVGPAGGPTGVPTVPPTLDGFKTAATATADPRKSIDFGSLEAIWATLDLAGRKEAFTSFKDGVIARGKNNTEWAAQIDANLTQLKERHAWIQAGNATPAETAKFNEDWATHQVTTETYKTAQADTEKLLKLGDKFNADLVAAGA